MNPFAVVALALVGLLAITIYLSSSERGTKNLEISQQKQELDTMKFDKDFSNFLDGGKPSKPSDEEISEKAVQIKRLEEEKRLAEIENEKRNKELQKSIDKLPGYEGEK